MIRTVIHVRVPDTRVERKEPDSLTKPQVGAQSLLPMQAVLDYLKKNQDRFIAELQDFCRHIRTAGNRGISVLVCPLRTVPVRPDFKAPNDSVPLKRILSARRRLPCGTNARRHDECFAGINVYVLHTPSRGQTWTPIIYYTGQQFVSRTDHVSAQLIATRRCLKT